MRRNRQKHQGPEKIFPFHQCDGRILLDDVLDLWKRSMSEHGLPCGEYAVRNMISLMTGEYYDCGSGGKRFRDCVLMEERAGGYRVSSMLRSALANPDFCSALEDVIGFCHRTLRDILYVR